MKVETVKHRPQSSLCYTPVKRSSNEMIPSHHFRAYRPTADLLTLVASFSGRCSNQELLSLSQRQSPQLLRPSRSTPISLLESAAAAPPAAPQPDPALSLPLEREGGTLLPLCCLRSYLVDTRLQVMLRNYFYTWIAPPGHASNYFFTGTS